jgi:hypothetical protein
VGRLDLRLALALGPRFELLVDALDVVAQDAAPVDRALYLVDRAAALGTTAGVVTVPLVVNPNFGLRTGRRAPGAAVRVGLRMGL